jgi:hypothetical protein
MPGFKSAMCLSAEFQAVFTAALLDQFDRGATLFGCQPKHGEASSRYFRKKKLKLATGDGACGKLQASRSFHPRLAHSYTHIGSASAVRGGCRRARTSIPRI